MCLSYSIVLVLHGSPFMYYIVWIINVLKQSLSYYIAYTQNSKFIIDFILHYLLVYVVLIGNCVKSVSFSMFYGVQIKMQTSIVYYWLACSKWRRRRKKKILPNSVSYIHRVNMQVIVPHRLFLSIYSIHPRPMFCL